MNVGTVIYKLRNKAKLTQAQFADILGVSQQSVQKWENGVATPNLEKIVAMSKYFGVSLDSLILGTDSRFVEEIQQASTIKPQYQTIPDTEFYPSNLQWEYRQSVEEGLDIEKYEEVFAAVAKLPKSEIKEKLGEVLFEIVATAKQREGYPYVEPSELEQIKALRKGNTAKREYDKTALQDKIHGAWMGRLCGCMLGKPLEHIRSNELIPFLRETNNYPLYRDVYRTDITPDIIEKYQFPFKTRDYRDEVEGMPVDDDSNYVVMAQEIIREFGRDFTPHNVACSWLKYQCKDSYWTAERVAFCNFVRGYTPPESAVYKNPYREWIGAQIRGDYFGYINPGNPEKAAEMAWRDASISHVKNGIYGEMFVAAMLAVAATTNDIEEIIGGGLAQIPYTSRLYEQITEVLEDYKAGMPQQSAFDKIHEKYDEYTEYGWCHTIPNAMIVVAALLYGKGDYSKSICMAVETAFDTDCNGATVGSVLGMANGIQSIPERWITPMQDLLHTSIFGVGTVKISDRIQLTMEHIAR